MGYINPLLNLPAGRAHQALPAEQRAPIEAVLRQLRDQANVEAENAWRRRKGPMAAYWRAVSTYARHLAHALRNPCWRQPDCPETRAALDGQQFDDIVKSFVDRLDAKHTHVKTVTSGGPPVAFHIGYAYAADALAGALAEHGIAVRSE